MSKPKNHILRSLYERETYRLALREALKGCREVKGYLQSDKFCGSHDLARYVNVNDVLLRLAEIDARVVDILFSREEVRFLDEGESAPEDDRWGVRNEADPCTTS